MHIVYNYLYPTIISNTKRKKTTVHNNTKVMYIKLVKSIIFMIYLSKLTWKDAHLNCKSQGLSLLKIKHRLESNYILKKFHFETASAFGDVMYIGLTRDENVR